ncbi:efflux RND transporter periplasmic adaptor subunit [Photobacterium sagamiensis]|uniref:efflux RND transporter periplasmic adaptor subunit n=1 Tax=Photobacterium sagamiensis TaxID=2910241 RepID=UPI003D11F81F
MMYKLITTLTPLSVLLLAGCSDAPATTIDISPRPVQVIELGSNQSTSFKRFSGVLEAEQSADLAFRVPGTMQEVLVKTGQKVSAGQIIARLDPHDYQVTVSELEARLEEAQAAHQLAKSERQRVRQATNDDALAAVNLDRAESGYKRSKAMVKVVKQNLTKAKDALSYTELTAPFDGVIGQRMRDQFEQATPGLPIFTLHQPQKLQAVIDVPESLANQFTVGQTAQVSWYGSKQVVSAQLKEVSTLPDPIKQTYRVTYKMDEGVQGLLPGKSVVVSSATSQENTSLYCLPYSALFVEKGDQKVYVVNSDQIEARRVVVQSLDAKNACVENSLKQGDKVVVSGVHFLKEGDAVGAINIVRRERGV